MTCLICKQPTGGQRDLMQIEMIDGTTRIVHENCEPAPPPECPVCLDPIEYGDLMGKVEMDDGVQVCHLECEDVRECVRCEGKGYIHDEDCPSCDGVGVTGKLY